MLKKSGVEPQAYRDAMARFAGAVHIVSTDGVAGRRGATVIAACSVSDEPATILVCVNRQNAKNEAFLENSRFALNTLAAHHEPLAVGFSGVTGLSSDERFALGRWDTITTGSPTLIDAIATFDCELIDAKDVASHRVLFGKVTGLRMTGNLDPLLYFNRSYRVL